MISPHHRRNLTYWKQQDSYTPLEVLLVLGAIVITIVLIIQTIYIWR